MFNVLLSGKSLFKWEGSADHVAHIEGDMKRLAETFNLTPSEISEAVFVEVMRNGGFCSSKEGVETLAVIWTLLSLPTGHPDHPGRYRDYVEGWDFAFDIKPDPRNEKKFSIAISGSFSPQGRDDHH